MGIAGIDLLLDGDDDHWAHAEESEDGDVLHDLVEELGVVEEDRGHMEDHRLPLVHLDVRSA